MLSRRAFLAGVAAAAVMPGAAAGGGGIEMELSTGGLPELIGALGYADPEALIAAALAKIMAGFDARMAAAIQADFERPHPLARELDAALGNVIAQVTRLVVATAIETGAIDFRPAPYVIFDEASSVPWDMWDRPILLRWPAPASGLAPGAPSPSAPSPDRRSAD